MIAALIYGRQFLVKMLCSGIWLDQSEITTQYFCQGYLIRCFSKKRTNLCRFISVVNVFWNGWWIHYLEVEAILSHCWLFSMFCLGNLRGLDWRHDLRTIQWSIMNRSVVRVHELFTITLWTQNRGAEKWREEYFSQLVTEEEYLACEIKIVKSFALFGLLVSEGRRCHHSFAVSSWRNSQFFVEIEKE